MCTSKPTKLNIPAIATDILHNKTANKDKIKRYVFTLIPNDNNVRSSNPNKSHACVKKVRLLKLAQYKSLKEIHHSMNIK